MGKGVTIFVESLRHLFAFLGLLKSRFFFASEREGSMHPISPKVTNNQNNQFLGVPDTSKRNIFATHHQLNLTEPCSMHSHRCSAVA